MNTTVNIVCYKSKTLANGEHPLMLSIYKDGKRKYLSLGLSVKAENWDFKKNKPKKSCPKKELILKIINDNIEKYSSQILEFKAEDKEYTTTNLIEKVNQPHVKITVLELLDRKITRLRSEGRLKYASTYKELKTSLLDFNTHLNTYFSEIDLNWLKNYENYLRAKGLGENSIGIRFRNLRALYNTAIREKIVKAEYYPFKEYKVSKLRKETVKRAIYKSDVEKIINYQTKHKYTQLAIDLFYFSYLSGGINFVDIAHLKNNNIIDGRLIYTRKKTKKMIKLPLQDRAIEIIEKYEIENSSYIFPILSSFHETEQQKANRVDKILRIVNCCLKIVGNDLNISINITTYCLRHKRKSYRLLINKLRMCYFSIGNDLETNLVLRYA